MDEIDVLCPKNYEENKKVVDKEEIVERIKHFISRDISKIEKKPLDFSKIIDYVKMISNFCSWDLDVMATYVANASLPTYYDIIKNEKEWEDLNDEKKNAIKRLYAFIINKDAIIYLNSIFPKKVNYFPYNFVDIPKPMNLYKKVSDYNAKKGKGNSFYSKKSYIFRNKSIDISKIKTMTTESLGFVGELNVEEVCEEIKEHLKVNFIDNELFAEKILGFKKYKFTYYILSAYKKWHDLTESNREVYIKMKAYLNCFKELEGELTDDNSENVDIYDDENYTDNVDYSFLDKKGPVDVGDKYSNAKGVETKENSKLSKSCLKRRHLENDVRKVPDIDSSSIIIDDGPIDKKIPAIINNEFPSQQQFPDVLNYTLPMNKETDLKFEFVDDDIYICDFHNVNNQSIIINSKPDRCMEFYKKTVSNEYLLNVGVNKLEVLLLAWTFSKNPPQIFKTYLSEFNKVTIDVVETFYDKTNVFIERNFQNLTIDDEFRRQVREILVGNTSRKYFISISSSIFENLFNGGIPSLMVKS
uniref:BRCT domain-containing protein n=1 Tax=Parastrongyloides trichosuri TaxID=131310 RepID=A0A0N5A0U3_PARTI